MVKLIFKLTMLTVFELFSKNTIIYHHNRGLRTTRSYKMILYEYMLYNSICSLICAASAHLGACLDMLFTRVGEVCRGRGLARFLPAEDTQCKMDEKQDVIRTARTVAVPRGDGAVDE